MASGTGSTGRATVVALVVAVVALMLIGWRSRDSISTKDSIRDGRSWPRIGALFHSDMSAGHFCSASVIDSSARNLIVTAAHCISGDGSGLVFVPGYDTGRKPWGVWPVHAVYLDQNWVTRQDPLRDWAFLAVDPIRWHGKRVNLEDVTSGLRLGFKYHARQPITVAGFRAGINDPLIKCYNNLSVYHQYAQFNCTGMTGGMSGAPLMVGRPNHRHVVGVIGGLHHGGCYANVSYASQFGWPTYLLFLRASSGVHPDVAPVPLRNGC